MPFQIPPFSLNEPQMMHQNSKYATNKPKPMMHQNSKYATNSRNQQVKSSSQVSDPKCVSDWFLFYAQTKQNIKTHNNSQKLNYLLKLI